MDSTWRSPNDEQGKVQAVRKAMRTLAHSVVIVTACHESSSLTPPEPIDPNQDNIELLSPYYRDFCGATISSLQTVTLGPPTMISFNLKMPSRTLSGLLHHKHFGVHLLRGKPDGAYIADAFLQPLHDEAFRALTRSGHWVGLGLGHEDSRVNNPDKNIPLIRGKGVFSFMRCEVIPDKCIVVGDHMVVIAKVASIGLPDREFKNESSLGYQHGSYGGRPGQLTGYDPTKPARKNKLSERVWQIRKNSLGIHNDVIGQARPTFETTLQEFCKQITNKLPDTVQEKAAHIFQNNYNWQVKALLLEEMRRISTEQHTNSQDLHEKIKERVKLNPGILQKANLLERLYSVGFPKTFWGQPSDQWPRENPPWAASMDSETQAALLGLESDRRRAGREVSARGTDKMKASIPVFESDPLGTTGEDEDGNLTGLSEEGYQKLAEQKHREGELEESVSSEGQEAGSEETILEEIGSVESSPSEQEEIPKKDSAS
jgi:hypothetical protein